MISELAPRIRVVKTLKREKPDRVPKDFWWTYQIGKLIQEKTGSFNPLEYFGCEMRTIRWLPTKYKRDFSKRPEGQSSTGLPVGE